MASVTDFTNMPAGNITAYGDLAKMLLSLNPIVSGVLIAVSAVTTVYLKRNTKATKTNTEANEAMAPLIELHKASMDKAQKEFLANVQTFNETITVSQAALLAEINKVKIVVTKVSHIADDKLSGIPKIQDTLAKIEEKQGEHDKTFKMLSNGIKKRTGQ